MTQRLVLATGLAVLASVGTRPGSAEAAPRPGVRKGETPAAAESAANAAGVGVIRIALGPRNDGGVLAAVAPAAPDASGKTARGQGQPRVTFEAAGSDFLINVLMEGASRATLRQDGREVLVSFPHPLPNFDAQALQAQAAGLLEGVSVGRWPAPGPAAQPRCSGGRDARSAGHGGGQGRCATPASARRTDRGPERADRRRSRAVWRPDVGDAGQSGADDRIGRP